MESQPDPTIGAQSTTKQNIYLRKFNGLGEKMSVTENTTIYQLLELYNKRLSLVQQSQQAQSEANNNFHLIYKGRNISEFHNSTLKELQIPPDGIIHLVFPSQKATQSQKVPLEESNSQNSFLLNRSELLLKVIFNGDQHSFNVSPNSTILDFKKQISAKLHLIFESLVLSHLGVELTNDQIIRDCSISHDSTLISLQFDMKKPEKKKLETRMVSSVTFSDELNETSSNNGRSGFGAINSKENNFPNAGSGLQQIQNKFSTSSRSIESAEKDDQSLSQPSHHGQMYKSDINGMGSNGNTKAAMMFKNALHQKIVETQSVVSGSFEDDIFSFNNDPNCVPVTMKNEEDTKLFILDCDKSHQIKDLRLKIYEIERLEQKDDIQLSLEENLFESIDLSKSGCITLGQLAKKMGRDKTIFIYRVVKKN